MKKSVISKLLSELEQLVQTEQESGVEFWLARDLQTVLGYANWQNFQRVIGDAKTACETSGHKGSDHFIGISKMIPPRQRRTARNPGFHAHPLRLLPDRAEWRPGERRDRLLPDLLRGPDPPAGNHRNLKKVERRLKTEEKKLPRRKSSE